MMEAPQRLPPHLLPRPKAAATSSSTTSLSALAVATPTQTSRASSRSRQIPTPSSAATANDTSDKATAALIRRVLVPYESQGGASDAKSVDEPLPPLTSSNDIDIQLYAIIAIVVKEFVSSWYGKITPDHGFVEEVVRIIAHCTRALEQRARTLDVGSLILDEIPELIENHISAFRASQNPLKPPPLITDSRTLYHALIPHPALSPIPTQDLLAAVEQQAANEAVYRQLLVQGVLAVLLPTEDLGNACLRTLVADIFGEMILGNGIGGKACEGWLIWEGLTKMSEGVKAQIEPKATGEEMEIDTRSRLEKFGLLSTNDDEQHVRPTRSSAISGAFWRMLQYGYLAYITICFVIRGFYAASARPLRLGGKASIYSNTASPEKNSTPTPSTKRAVLTFHIFSLSSRVLDLPERMPWFSGAMDLVRYHLVHGIGRVGAPNGILDRFLTDLLTTHVLSPALIPPLLLNLRTTLFPHNALAPGRATPSPAEQIAIKWRCAAALLELVPKGVAKRLFLGSRWRGDDGVHARKIRRESRQADETIDEPNECTEDLIHEMETILDVFGDAYCNKHLIYGIVELCIVRLVPEVGKMGVSELMDARLGEGWEKDDLLV